MSDKQATILDLDTLLDTAMSSVETLPDYVQLSDGKVRLKCKGAEIKKYEKTKDKEASASLIITYELLDTYESKEPAFPNGSLVTDRFQATEDGIKYFKKQAMKIMNVVDLENATLRDVFDGLEGEEFDAVITTRQSKMEDGRVFVNVNIRPVHEQPAA